AQTIEASLDQPFDYKAPMQVGKRYSISVDRDGRFLSAALELEPAHVFHAIQDENGLRCWKEEVVLDFKTETLSFEIDGTLTESVLNTGEGTELALKLSNLFRWDIDFHTETVRGDICRVLFERRYADDRPSGYGRILSAVYEGKKTGTKTAILFNDEYYDANGMELKKNFLRSPLSVIRVTSRFGKRFHPVLRVWRKHNGVDYAAAQGTPVWSVAGGVVTFSGWQNGYGNYVCIKHDNGYESRYGHLHRIFVAKGQRVKQRQRIGTVGMTGLATGSHLDFQLLVGNRHVNPLNVKMAQSLRSVPAPLTDRFARLAQDRLLALKGLMVTQGPEVNTKKLTLQ
ncbi:MAG: M23 family metallopeptidase, partial [Syntrophaceae bacterium]|nr:M23 family metallopeptidase [Syntrophaceae bacterium]